MPGITPKFKRIARFAPLIGFLIGVLQALLMLTLFLLNWPQNSLPFVGIAFNLWITGGIHFDGLIDTADGISAGPAKCLEAMKDSRVGASGVIALAINLALQIAALHKLGLFYLIALPIASFWGRYSQLIAIGNYPSIQKESSSDFHRDNWAGNIKESIPSFIIFLLLIVTINFTSLIYFTKTSLIIAVLIGFIPSIIIPYFLARRIGGHSGDTYGASVVLVETFLLITLAFILPGN